MSDKHTGFIDLATREMKNGRAGGGQDEHVEEDAANQVKWRAAGGHTILFEFPSERVSGGGALCKDVDGVTYCMLSSGTLTLTVHAGADFSYRVTLLPHNPERPTVSVEAAKGGRPKIIVNALVLECLGKLSDYAHEACQAPIKALVSQIRDGGEPDREGTKACIDAAVETAGWKAGDECFDVLALFLMGKEHAGL
jgi:hypothetical protein